jgi:hypothetical protein
MAYLDPLMLFCDVMFLPALWHAALNISTSTPTDGPLYDYVSAISCFALTGVAVYTICYRPLKSSFIEVFVYPFRWSQYISEFFIRYLNIHTHNTRNMIYIIPIEIILLLCSTLLSCTAFAMIVLLFQYNTLVIYDACHKIHSLISWQYQMVQILIHAIVCVISFFILSNQLYDEHVSVLINIDWNRMIWNRGYYPTYLSVSGDCTICLDSMSTLQASKMRSCSHVFHTKCIANWYRNQPARTCPVCRVVS